MFDWFNVRVRNAHWKWTKCVSRFDFKRLNNICITVHGSYALVRAYLIDLFPPGNLQYLLGHLNLTRLSLLYLPTLASPFLKMAFPYSPYVYLLFLMLLDLVPFNVRIWTNGRTNEWTERQCHYLSCSSQLKIGK